MNPLLFIALLGISIVCNMAQLAAHSRLEHELGDAQAQATQAHGAAQQCDAEVQHLQELATTRAKDAEVARLEAQRLARLHRGRGDAILSAPPAKPGDDCGSAQVRLDSWWEQRK